MIYYTLFIGRRSREGREHSSRNAATAAGRKEAEGRKEGSRSSSTAWQQRAYVTAGTFP